ncbi:hypothetical protein WH43_12235 [Rheinheimera sp. KL1]|nr:hypothetical protein WH43_12235 [Rheinheimera sp. KL1]
MVTRHSFDKSDGIDMREPLACRRRLIRIYPYQIEKSYCTVKAVSRISFEVQSGQIFALLGPSDGEIRS